MVLLLFLSCKIFAGFTIELDVTFNEDSLHYQNIFVIAPDMEEAGDTITIFNSMAFKGQLQTSLFFTASQKQEIKITAVTSDGKEAESRSFQISPQRSTFSVLIDAEKIKVRTKDFLYPQKNDDEKSYFVFLLIFFIVKLLIACIYIFLTKLPKRLISISAGIFLFSGFFEWVLPVNYLIRFFIIALIEFLLIIIFAKKDLTWIQSIILIIIVNLAGFGIIVLSYLIYVFW
jgi:hypothetical protein